MFKFYFLVGTASLLLTSCGALEKRKQQALTHHNIALSFLKKCMKSQALTHLLKAQSYSSRDFSIQNSLGATYFSMGKKTLAEKALKRALRLNSKLTEARVDLARIYLDMGRKKLALKYLNQANEDITYSNFPKLLSLKGEYWFRNKNLKKAKKWFLQARALPQGKNCFTSSYLGRIALRAGQSARAIDHLKEAVRLCSQQKALCEKRSFHESYYLGQAYFRLKNTKLAEYHFQLFLKQAQENDPLKKKTKSYLKRL